MDKLSSHPCIGSNGDDQYFREASARVEPYRVGGAGRRGEPLVFFVKLSSCGKRVQLEVCRSAGVSCRAPFLLKRSLARSLVRPPVCPSVRLFMRVLYLWTSGHLTAWRRRRWWCIHRVWSACLLGRAKVSGPRHRQVLPHVSRTCQFILFANIKSNPSLGPLPTVLTSCYGTARNPCVFDERAAARIIIRAGGQG
jgi:hypothetical protein